MNLCKFFVRLFCLALFIAYITLQYYSPGKIDSIHALNWTKERKVVTKENKFVKEEGIRYVYVDNVLEAVLQEWGGNCTKRDWDKCRMITETWNVSYPIDRKHPERGYDYLDINCTIPSDILCLWNGWTVTRCQLLCMRCNREIQTKYEKYVAREGPCELDVSAQDYKYNVSINNLTAEF